MPGNNDSALQNAIAYATLAEQRILQLQPTHPLPVTVHHLKNHRNTPQHQHPAGDVATQRALRDERGRNLILRKQNNVAQAQLKQLRDTLADARAKLDAREAELVDKERSLREALARAGNQTNSKLMLNRAAGLPSAHMAQRKPGIRAHTTSADEQPRGRVPSPSSVGKEIRPLTAPSDLRTVEGLLRERARLQHELADLRRESAAEVQSVKQAHEGLKRSLEGYAAQLGLPKGAVGERLLREHAEATSLLDDAASREQRRDLHSRL